MDRQTWFVIRDNEASEYLLRHSHGNIIFGGCGDYLEWTSDINEFQDHSDYELYSSRDLANSELIFLQYEFGYNSLEIVEIEAITEYRIKNVSDS